MRTDIFREQAKRNLQTTENSEYVRLLEAEVNRRIDPAHLAEKLTKLVKASRRFPETNGVLHAIMVMRTVFGTDELGLKEAKDMLEHAYRVEGVPL